MDQNPVIIVGAGLAGLCCAKELGKSGMPVILLESHSVPGGRVRTDLVDGFQLDHGFQVLQTAYPEAAAQLNYTALQLQPFAPGALIRTRGGFVEMSDPWRRPGKLFTTLFNGVGTFSDRLRLARLRLRVSRLSDEQIQAVPDQSTRTFLLQTCGFSEDIVNRFFRPWFSGVFLEKDLATSSHYFQFLFRIFATGNASLPSEGMASIPRQLAASLPAGTLRTNTQVNSVTPREVRLTSGETLSARAVVLAVQGPEASRLSQGAIPAPGACSTTCFYFAAPKAPFSQPLLVLNGDESGPINNLSVVSNVAPSYAPAGKALISVSVVGDHAANLKQTEAAIRLQLKSWYGASTDEWSMLRAYPIHFALPAQPPGFQAAGGPLLKTANGLFTCGDSTTTASIHGAMLSGRLVARDVAMETR